MKLKNRLIVTLPDFARYFNYGEFWEKRKLFVRDMHPSKVYYWEKGLEEAYLRIVDWITQGDDAVETVRQSGLCALEQLIGRKITVKEIKCAIGNVDLTTSIIRVQAGTSLMLPSVDGNLPDTFRLSQHKIEVYGTSNKPAVISIGTGSTLSLYASEFVYVTALNGQFIEFLPTRLQNDIYVLTQVAEEGVFFPKLDVRMKFSGNRMSYPDVISFAVTDDGYLFIDSQGHLFIMSNTVNALKFMLKHECEALYVKAHGERVVVLYKDGTLKSTDYMGSMGRVIRVDV